MGGLVEAAGTYEGATFVPPADVDALTAALAALPAERGRRFADPHSWETTVAAYSGVFERLGHPRTGVRRPDGRADLRIAS